MNNVHQLVVPVRNDACGAQAQTVGRTGEVLILPCVRYERIESSGARRTAAQTIAFEALRQDLTA